MIDLKPIRLVMPMQEDLRNNGYQVPVTLGENICSPSQTKPEAWREG